MVIAFGVVVYLVAASVPAAVEHCSTNNGCNQRKFELGNYISLGLGGVACILQCFGVFMVWDLSDRIDEWDVNGRIRAIELRASGERPVSRHNQKRGKLTHKPRKNAVLPEAP